MSNRRIVNFKKIRQRDLASQFPWLIDIDLIKPRSDIQIISVSVFDHWLSREEACEKLEDVSVAEQTRRDVLLGDFCMQMINATEALSFTQRCRRNRRIIFRRFLSTAVSSEYCKPGGGTVRYLA